MPRRVLHVRYGGDEPTAWAMLMTGVGMAGRSSSRRSPRRGRGSRRSARCCATGCISPRRWPTARAICTPRGSSTRAGRPRGSSCTSRAMTRRTRPSPGRATVSRRQGRPGPRRSPGAVRGPAAHRAPAPQGEAAGGARQARAARPGARQEGVTPAAPEGAPLDGTGRGERCVYENRQCGPRGVAGAGARGAAARAALGEVPRQRRRARARDFRSSKEGAKKVAPDTARV